MSKESEVKDGIQRTRKNRAGNQQKIECLLNWLQDWWKRNPPKVSVIFLPIIIYILLSFYSCKGKPKATDREQRLIDSVFHECDTIKTDTSFIFIYHN